MGYTSTMLCLLFKGNHKNEKTTAMCSAPRNIAAQPSRNRPIAASRAAAQLAEEEEPPSKSGY